MWVFINYYQLRWNVDVNKKWFQINNTKGIFIIQADIYDRAFLQKYLAFICLFFFFLQKGSIIDVQFFYIRIFGIYKHASTEDVWAKQACKTFKHVSTENKQAC